MLQIEIIRHGGVIGASNLGKPDFNSACNVLIKSSVRVFTESIVGMIIDKH